MKRPGCSVSSATLNSVPSTGRYVITSSYLHDRTAVWSNRSGEEAGLLNLRLSVSQGASLGDILLAPAYPVEKATL